MNVVPLPYVHYSLSKAKQTVGDYEGAFQALVKGLAMIELSPYASPDVRVLGIRLMEVLLHEASGKGVDLDGDDHPDPGSLTQKAWLAERLLRMNQRQAARDLYHEALLLNPDDAESRNRLDQILAEDRLDAIQMEKKNFKEKYVRHPFTPFNFCMAGAFLIKKSQQAASLDALGETLLDYAEHLKPDSPDVHLLRGWYHHDRGEAKEAVLAAKRALEIDPDYASIWMGLGFFSMKANQPEQAIEAFQKTLDLFPHGPNRAEILAILRGLEAGVAGS
jgi:tetratricopeptide (TPR) repeat protein